MDNFINSLNKKFQNHEYCFIFLFLTIIILIFNLYDIFFVKTFYVDDNHRYILGLENKIHPVIYHRNPIRAYVIFPLYKLLSINPIYARLAQTLVFYIPLSFSFFYIYRVFIGLSTGFSFFASVLPCILPGQWQIPLFIDGSYTVQGLLVFNIALIVSLKYLSTTKKGLIYFLFAVFIYWLSIGMMDHSIFLLPVMIMSYLMMGKFKVTKKLVMLSVVQLVLAAFGTYKSLYPSFPHASTAPIDPSFVTLISRAKNFIVDVLPASYSLHGKPFAPVVLWAIFLIIFIFGFLASSWRQKALLVLGGSWAFFAYIPFLTITPFHSPRYAHIASFGIVFCLLFSIGLAFKKKSGTNSRLLLVLFSVLLIYSGFTRLNIVKAKNLAPNKCHNNLSRFFAENEHFPLNSQIVVLSPYIATGGYWVYSTGYLKYVTGRKDITGLVGVERFFYNPFDSTKRGFARDYQMCGLSFDLPIFLFRYVSMPNYIHLVSIKYALSVENGKFSLHKFDATGRARKVLTKSTREKFIKFMDNFKIKFSDVAFAKEM